MHRIIRNDKGLTLIETLVTLAIMASIAGVLVSFQWTTLTSWCRGDNQAELQQSLRLGLNQMTRIARLSSKVTVINPNLLEFEYKDMDNNVAARKRTRFYVEGSILYMETSNYFKQSETSGYWLPPGKNQVALYITSLTQSWNSQYMYADFRLEGKMPDGQTYTVQTRMTPRLVDR